MHDELPHSLHAPGPPHRRKQFQPHRGAGKHMVQCNCRIDIGCPDKLKDGLSVDRRLARPMNGHDC